MKRESNDVKALSAQCVTYVTQSCESRLDDVTIRLLVPALVNGTKERNTLVKSNSELALVSLLRMRSGDSTLQVRTCTGTNIAIILSFYYVTALVSGHAGVAGCRDE